MQPLKFRSSPDFPIEADAIALLGSIGRYQPPAGQKQRVRQRMLELSVPRRISMLQPMLVAGLVLITAVASAGLARYWLSRTKSSSQESHPLHQQTQLPSVSSPVRSLTVATNDSPQSAYSTHENTESLRLPPRAVQPSEKVLVFDAMRALRREGHPEQASKLLDEYLRRYPQGSLAEEALALAIEASTALGDPKAKNLADRYLALYPNGRFRSAAERARARVAP
jgi:hypothetical protein